MSNLKLRWSLAILTGLFAHVCHAAIISTYTFPGSDPGGDATAPTAANATFSFVSRTNVTAVSFNDQFVSTNYTAAAVIDLGEYLEFTVTADAGYTLDLESLSFKHTRNDQNSNRTGPQNGAVRASFESFATGSGTGSTFAPITSQTSSTWDFVDFSIAAGGSATFRFYGWNSLGIASNNMQLRLDDITLNGAVTLVPPPGTPPTVNDAVINGVTAGDIVPHTFTANEPDGDTVIWSGFTFNSYTPAYGGGGPGPAVPASFNASTQEFSWNSLGSPRGIYEWRVTASDVDGSDEGRLTVHVVEVPEPASLALLGLAVIGLVGACRRT